MEEILNIIKKFMSRFDKSEIEGILLYGSVVSGKCNKDSDIDILIVKNKEYNSQALGCTKIDGKKIEYFIYGIDYLYDSALKEIEKNDPSHLTKFITSKIIYDKNGNFSEIVDKIRKLYEIPIKEKHDNSVKKKIFHIKNRLEDLNSLISTDSFYSVYYDILSKIRDLYTESNGLMYVPLAKTEKLYKDPVYMKKYIESNVHKGPDRVFMDKYLKALKLDNLTLMTQKINDLYEYAVKKENFNGDEFFLEFDEDSRFGI